MESQSQEKNIINIAAKNNNYNEPIKIDNNIEEIDTKIPEKDSYLNIIEKQNNQESINITENSNLNNLNNEELKPTPEYSETSSYYFRTSSYFSRFSSFTSLSLGKIGTGFINMKNCIMNKFRKNAYLFPLVLLIFFWNECFENFERNNIIIIFSILMGLIVLFHLYKYVKEIIKYKKIAKEDKKKLMELLEENNIKKEDIGNNVILLSEFFEGRIRNSELDYDTYMKYVFPYLVKYLKKEGYILEKQKDEDLEENNLNYWKKM